MPLTCKSLAFLSKRKSIITTKGMSLLARGSKGNWKLLASILVVGKRVPKYSDFVLVFENPLSYYSDFRQFDDMRAMIKQIAFDFCL